MQVSCKKKSSGISSNPDFSKNGPAGPWFSLCSLSVSEGEIYSTDTKLNAQDSGFNSTTTYYADGACKEPLFSMQRTGSFSATEANHIEFWVMNLKNLKYTLHEANLVRRYNELGVHKKTWVVNEPQDISASLADDPDKKIWGDLVPLSSQTLNFFAASGSSKEGVLLIKQ
jgi:hypothetical protein